MSLRRAPAIAMAALVVLSAREAGAYCRTSTCLPSGSVCDPPSETDCGFAIAWPSDCVGVALQQDGTVQLPFEEVRTAVLNGFAAWMAPVCAGSPPGIAVIDMGTVPCANAEYNKKAGNVNVVVFRDRAWTHPEGANYIALTTVTFSDETGEIYDADMEINSAGFQLTTQDTGAGFDLQAVVTHEAGHFFGLAHSPDPESTMYESYEEGMGGQRTLATDDIAGICATYPPRPIDASTCNPIPRHGFAAECAAEQPKHGCAVQQVGEGDLKGYAAGVLVLAAAGLRRRRRRSQNAASSGSGGCYAGRADC